ncbi:hypothetical protein [Micromonospora sp. WMMD1082]|uniref:DUF3846 domain-containing protein n=1 Tax=Micromonospora sp. WMMD1082 TaxID=3016104 RepID=UPI0024162F11|nr:hypothetical protein [Micromonospora sp. WMMD1082]MDG4795405.1 hypothetical protein [Micromonospora sp. WMMD1082]
MARETFRYIVVATDGTSHEHHTRQRDGDVASLLRRAVGGVPAPIPIGVPDLHVWGDEDGHRKALSPNPVARLLVARLGGGELPLVGPIVLTGRHACAATSLTTNQIDAVLAALAHCR